MINLIAEIRTHRQKEPYISRLLYKAASIFCATLLSDCDADAIASFRFEELCHQLEDPPASVLIDQPLFLLASRLR